MLLDLIYTPHNSWLLYYFEGVNIVLDTQYTLYFLSIIDKIFIPLLYYFVLLILLLFYIMTYNLVSFIPNTYKCRKIKDKMVTIHI